MDSRSAFRDAIVTLGLIGSIVLNAPKFYFFWTMTPFRIYWWQRVADSQVSASSPLWLTVHLAVALLDVFVHSYIYFTQNQVKYRAYIHWAHVLLILKNIMNFGQNSWQVAVLANGLPLIALLYFNHKRNVVLYLMTLYIIVWFELGMIVRYFVV